MAFLLRALKREIRLPLALVQHQAWFDHMVEAVCATNRNMRKVLTNRASTHESSNPLVTGFCSTLTFPTTRGVYGICISAPNVADGARVQPSLRVFENHAPAVSQTWKLRKYVDQDIREMLLESEDKSALVGNTERETLKDRLNSYPL